MAFQMMFAIITVALISGALSDRLKFGGWVLFAFGWFTLVYVPVAHWVWGGGWIGANVRALDFAGGTAVHINAGAAALGAGHGARQADRLAAGEHAPAQRAVRRARRRPAVVRLVRLQRRLRADRRRHHRGRLRQHPGRHGRRPDRLVVVEWLRDGKPTLVGASSGAVAGLVAITPACGFIAPLPAVAARPHRRCGLRARRRPEVQARLRRLARRGRRALRRWLDRLAVHRLLRHHPGQRRRSPTCSVPTTACSTAAA